MPKTQYVAIIKDHSVSINSYRLTEACKNDYNMNVATLKELARTNNIRTLLTVIECGAEYAPGLVRVAVENFPIEQVYSTHNYVARGGATPLFDSVGKAIEILEKQPRDDDTAFLIAAITDGENNMMNYWNASKLSRKIQELQNTDKWTFTFRVPRGYKNPLVKLGVPEDNILEWEQTSQGSEKATHETVQAYTNYYSTRSTGKTSTQKFFTNIANVSKETIKATLRNISHEVVITRVHDGVEGQAIKTYIERKHGPYVSGAAFYQLVKPEKIQDHKLIVIRDRISGEVYAGHAARDLLGMTKMGEIKVVPGNHGNYDIFVQSKSVNRILPVGTYVLHWPNALYYVH